MKTKMKMNMKTKMNMRMKMNMKTKMNMKMKMNTGTKMNMKIQEFQKIIKIIIKTIISIEQIIWKIKIFL